LGGGGLSGPRLVLWDVDHTLVDTSGVGRELYAGRSRSSAAGGWRWATHRAAPTPTSSFETLVLHWMTASEACAYPFWWRRELFPDLRSAPCWGSAG